MTQRVVRSLITALTLSLTVTAMPPQAASLSDLLAATSAGERTSRQLRTTAETRELLPYQQVPNRRSYLCTRLQSTVRSRLQQQCSQGFKGSLGSVQANSTGCRCQSGFRRNDGTTELRCWQVGTARCTYSAAPARRGNARDPFALPSNQPPRSLEQLPSNQPKSPQLPR